jgi:hypothetical protein
MDMIFHLIVHQVILQTYTLIKQLETLMTII